MCIFCVSPITVLRDVYFHQHNYASEQDGFKFLRYVTEYNVHYFGETPITTVFFAEETQVIQFYTYCDIAQT